VIVCEPLVFTEVGVLDDVAVDDGDDVVETDICEVEDEESRAMEDAAAAELLAIDETTDDMYGVSA
jgi:hypothetical protein